MTKFVQSAAREWRDSDVAEVRGIGAVGVWVGGARVLINATTTRTAVLSLHMHTPHTPHTHHTHTHTDPTVWYG